MGKKGGTTYQERPQSAQESALLATQNKMLDKQIGIAQQQEDRSQAAYDDWVQSYRGMETGEIRPGASRANGYSNNPNIMSQNDYARRQSEYQSKLAKLNNELQGMQKERSNSSEPALNNTVSAKGR